MYAHSICDTENSPGFGEGVKESWIHGIDFTTRFYVFVFFSIMFFKNCVKKC